MKTMPLRLLTLIALSLVSFPSASLAASAPKIDSKTLAAVRAADDERVAAMLAADRARLDAIFSDDLSYTHSSGTHDTKVTYRDKLVTGDTKYTLYQYTDRTFTQVAPGMVTMNAKVRIKGRSGASGELDLFLSVLAIYREEQGKWRFLVWQSAKLPLPDAAVTKK